MTTADTALVDPGLQALPPDLLGYRAFTSLWSLLALVCLLLPAWFKSGAGFTPDVRIALLGCPWLPAAVALLLSIRAGGINLATWGQVALGAIVSWWMISAGLSVPLALLLAICTGYAAGIVQSLATAALERPLARRMSWSKAQWIASAAVAAVAGVIFSLVAVGLHKGLALKRLSPEAIDPCNAPSWLLLLSAVCLSVTLAVLAVIDHRLYARKQLLLGPRTALRAALICGGGLSTLSGAILLLARSEVLPGLMPVTDLRVALAVLLAGAFLWRGRGSAMLATLLLPAGMLAATIWQEIVMLPMAPRIPPLIVPIILVGAMQVMIVGRHNRMLRSVVAGACLMGILLVAATSLWLFEPSIQKLALWGGAIWVTGVGIGIYRWMRRRGGDVNYMPAPAAK